MRIVVAATLCCLSFAALAQQAGEPRKLDPQLLGLCRSTDPAARLYCLRAIAAQGDPAGEAKDLIGEMADHDPAVREAAADAYARLYGRPPARPPTPPKPATASGDPMRVIFAPTAFTRPQGATSFNAFELGTLTFDHGVTSNVAIGLRTAIPIGALVLGPTLRVGLPFDGGAIGFQAEALLFAPFVGSADSYFVAGGGPMLTLGTYDRYVNLGVLGYFVTSNGDGVIVPHAGVSVLAAPRLRIGAEAYVPGAYGPGARNVGLGKIGVVAWGVRLFGEHVWGDIALVDLICDGCGSLYRVLPLGIPFLNLGAGW